MAQGHHSHLSSPSVSVNRTITRPGSVEDQLLRPCPVSCSSMWRTALVILHLLVLGPLLGLSSEAMTPQNCSLKCILQLVPLSCCEQQLLFMCRVLNLKQQGGPGCEYCRITPEDSRALGFRSSGLFGSCVPWPCFQLLGEQDPHICQHYVHAPNNVTLEFVHDPDPSSDTLVVSWRPSYYGIAFLRGFQVSLQALGGPGVACQLFLFHRNLSLSASDAQKVYKSDPFPSLPLGAQYAVTVMALPVPERWEKFYQSKIFSTRSCAEKNGLDRCKEDWYPTFVQVQQREHEVTVTFNLAPSRMGISSYFSWCYANGKKKYMTLVPDLSRNATHHSFQVKDLQEGANYTCEIAANEVDAVRKVFSFQTGSTNRDHPATRSVPGSLAVALPLAVLLAAIVVVLAVVVARRRRSTWKNVVATKPDIIRQHREHQAQEEVVSLASSRSSPPRLLICYSSCEGAAHVKAVMQLGAFIQQHMATQVCLDLWDTLSVAVEGSLAWHCRQIRDSSFIMVICSPGVSGRGAAEDERTEQESHLVIQLLREEVARAKAGGHDLSKYMTATFEYCDERDVPMELRLVPHYSLAADLPLLFSHLHGVALHRPGGYVKISHISEEGFTELPAGMALQRAIDEAAATQERHRPM
ncbi:interleukin-17 receptor D isoform X1 [Synchiropus splendidus]|uniref:interleukin-17 receptor D isoform X1 n=2 Tax=Synchiropus splendidus TaxID=270530 RepID=UPI00237EA6E7|nr:interleukin-17 receptor D isoform X1 [Synchiropus splendidus]